jgi:PAS domain S-box-containing protein
MFSFLLRGSRPAILFRAFLLIAVIAFLDWRDTSNLPLGFLYLLPMLMVGAALNRWQISGVAALCMVLTELFDEYKWGIATGLPRDILYFAAFLCAGLFVYESTRSRELTMRHLADIERVSEGRREAEEQLKVLIESSPAAIFTAGANGRVLLANNAAHRMFEVPLGTLPGMSIHEFVPALKNVTGAQAFRTNMQAQARRAGGEAFLADVWFSTYDTSSGPRLAAMVVDVSEELRTREESSLHQLLTGSRIMAAAASHEIRNICGAIGVVHQNMARDSTLRDNADFEALGGLVVALEQLASLDLRQVASNAASIDLASLLAELRIIMEPQLREQGIDVTWSVEPRLPAVWADRSSLIQVFLNLIKNSQRAMQSSSQPALQIGASRTGSRVLVEVTDSGNGVAHPERLFRPFQTQAEATGLGLYVSRAFLRSFHGDLRYKPNAAGAGGATFIVDLEVAAAVEEIA